MHNTHKVVPPRTQGHPIKSTTSPPADQGDSTITIPSTHNHETDPIMEQEQPTQNNNEEQIAASDNITDEETNEGTRRPPTMNTTNLRTNIVFGHEMDLPKEENTTRLISLNVNGLRRGDDYQDILAMAQAFKTSSVDWASLGETNIDWRSEAPSKVYKKFQRVYHHLKLSTSSSNIKFNTMYQPGGTATMITYKYIG